MTGQLLGVVTGTVSGIRAGGMDVDGMLTLKRAPVTRTTTTPGADTDLTSADSNQHGWLRAEMSDGTLAEPVTC